MQQPQEHEPNNQMRIGHHHRPQEDMRASALRVLEEEEEAEEQPTTFFGFAQATVTSTTDAFHAMFAQTKETQSFRVRKDTANTVQNVVMCDRQFARFKNQLRSSGTMTAAGVKAAIRPAIDAKQEAERREQQEEQFGKPRVRKPKISMRAMTA